MGFPSSIDGRNPSALRLVSTLWAPHHDSATSTRFEEHGHDMPGSVMAGHNLGFAIVLVAQATVVGEVGSPACVTTVRYVLCSAARSHVWMGSGTSCDRARTGGVRPSWGPWGPGLSRCPR